MCLGMIYINFVYCARAFSGRSRFVAWLVGLFYLYHMMRRVPVCIFITIIIL